MGTLLAMDDEPKKEGALEKARLTPIIEPDQCGSADWPPSGRNEMRRPAAR